MPSGKKKKTLRSHGKAIPVSLFLETLCAMHLSSYVDSPFPDTGGLMIVGPPGVLKSTMLSVTEFYPDVVSVSDINTRTLIDLRDQISARVIRSLVIPEYKKLWDRHAYTAMNVEGTLQALVGEGFGTASFEDQRLHRMKARCTVLSAMTPHFQALRFREWEESGFNRRFLWSLVRLQNPALLDEAVEEWRRIEFRVQHIPLGPTPKSATIPNLTTQRERAECRGLVKYQPGGSHALQTAVLVKILAVFKWWYRMLKRPDRDAMQTVRMFSHSLGKEGAELIL